MPELPAAERLLTNDERQRIGERVRLLRLERRLKQRALARRAGVALGTLQMIEAGAGRSVRPENLTKVAEALDTTVAALRSVTSTAGAPMTRAAIDTSRLHPDIIDAVRTLLDAGLPEQARRNVSELVVRLLRQPDTTLIRDTVSIVKQGSFDTAATKPLSHGRARRR